MLFSKNAWLKLVIFLVIWCCDNSLVGAACKNKPTQVRSRQPTEPNHSCFICLQPQLIEEAEPNDFCFLLQPQLIRALCMHINRTEAVKLFFWLIGHFMPTDYYYGYWLCACILTARNAIPRERVPLIIVLVAYSLSSSEADLVISALFVRYL